MKIFGLEIGKYNYDEFFNEITEFLLNTTQGRGRAIFTPNPEICLKTLEDTEFLKILQNADYLTSDGIGLYLAYQMNDFMKPFAFLLFPYFLINILFRKKYLYERYGERICGSDITKSLVEFAVEKQIKIAILDRYNPTDETKIASQEVFQERLIAAFPGLDFDFYVLHPEKKEEIFRSISSSNAKIVFSTLGMKMQEQSILEVLSVCPNLRLGLGIGSGFDYFTGYQKRSPKVFRNLGFEWLYRIFTSPNKIQRLGRIYNALILFPIKVLLYKK